MAIQRSGPTPNFFDYICNYLLVPFSGPPSIQLMGLIAPGHQLQWIEIPSFQRGISWDIDNVKELLGSNSILLGNAILSQLNTTPGQFTHLPLGQPQYLVLVDGLQRLAVGTAFLHVLHDLVLSPTPTRPGDAGYFSALTARVAPLSAFYFHNNKEFLQHPRRAICDQYIGLRTAIAGYVDDELSAGRAAQLANSIVLLFLTRQVALDIYFNFNRIELLSTFIGINTVRVDLGPVDLLRANILEQATGSNWSQNQLESIENDFTTTLTADQKPKQDYLPFVNAALKCISLGKGFRLFLSWGGPLLKSDVDDFLKFLEEFEVASSSNPYLVEIAECGKLPVSIVIAYYYIDYLHGSKVKPSFLTGGSAENGDLQMFLIACYRLIVEGSIGRTTSYLEALVEGTKVVTLGQLAENISLDFLGRSLGANLDLQWLEIHLGAIDQKRAPRIFNALLLPVRSTAGGFSPIRFGRSAKAFHVDHLIPDSLLQLSLPGGNDGHTLRNFAPLPTNQNRVAKATSCSSKLSAGGIYSAYCSGVTHFVHPYAAWLLSMASTQIPQNLDSQALLENNSFPDIGSQRIAWIANSLVSRL